MRAWYLALIVAFSVGGSAFAQQPEGARKQARAVRVAAELAVPRSSELRPFELPGQRDFNARSFRSNVVGRREWKTCSIRWALRVIMFWR